MVSPILNRLFVQLFWWKNPVIWNFFDYFDSQMKIHSKQSANFVKKKSGFVDSGFVKACHKLNICFVTCSWLVFTNSESTNLRFFSCNFSYLLLKQGRIILLRSKNVFITIYFHKKGHFAATTSKENKKFFTEKNLGFVVSEFVKSCQEQVIESLPQKTWFHKFRNYETTIFFREVFFVFFWSCSCKVFFFCDNKYLQIHFLISIEEFYLVSKAKVNEIVSTSRFSFQWRL
jgi:hypothetical protein